MPQEITAPSIFKKTGIIKKLALGVLLTLMGVLNLPAQRVYMTGDSHVFAKVYPNKVEEILKTQHPEMEFGWWAKNGICFYSFNSTPEYWDSIMAFRPEILIVHLGTNGAYANNFTRQAFRNEMEQFYATLTEAFPEVKVVFVTPFTNKKRRNKKRGRWHVNTKNRDVADEIIAFVADHPNTFVIDNNAEVGMDFLRNRALIRPDNVHLTEAGYEKLGTMVGTEILEIAPLWAPQLPPSPPQPDPKSSQIHDSFLE